MISKATTLQQFFEELPDDRRVALQAVRETVLRNLPAGYEERMQDGGILYFVPHSVYPNGYHCDPKQPVPFVGIASQKNHMAVYMICLYVDAAASAEFVREYTASGKKLDMGKCCVRFKKLADLPLEVIGAAVARATVAEFLAHYEAGIPPSARKRLRK